MFFFVFYFFFLLDVETTDDQGLDGSWGSTGSEPVNTERPSFVGRFAFICFFFVVVSWFWVRFRGPHLLETGICGGATVFFIVSANEETETTARALLDDIFGRFSVFFRLSRPNHKVVCRRPRWMRPRTRSRRQSSPSRGIPCVVSRGKKEKKRT